METKASEQNKKDHIFGRLKKVTEEHNSKKKTPKKVDTKQPAIEQLSAKTQTLVGF